MAAIIAVGGILFRRHRSRPSGIHAYRAACLAISAWSVGASGRYSASNARPNYRCRHGWYLS